MKEKQKKRKVVYSSCSFLLSLVFFIFCNSSLSVSAAQDYYNSTSTASSEQESESVNENSAEYPNYTYDSSSRYGNSEKEIGDNDLDKLESSNVTSSSRKIEQTPEHDDNQLNKEQQENDNVSNAEMVTDDKTASKESQSNDVEDEINDRDSSQQKASYSLVEKDYQKKQNNYTKLLTKGLSGWQLDGSDYYYKTNDGSLIYDDWAWIGGKWYYFDYNGKMVSSGLHEERESPNGEYFYYLFNRYGALERTAQWHKSGSDWYYINNNGAASKETWQWINGKWYYFDYNSRMVSSGVHEEKSSPNGDYRYYLFNNDGALVRSVQWYYNGSNWYRTNKDGTVVTNAWRLVGNKWYYFDWNGETYSDGRYYINGKYYNFASDGHMK